MADTEQTKPVEDRVFPPAKIVQDEAHINSMEQYREMYKESVEDPESFWGKIAKDFYWQSPPTGKFFEYNFDHREGPIFIKWLAGAKTNICYNVLDRNIERGLGDKIAFYW
jgi:acetyl-CoA synthetase